MKRVYRTVVCFIALVVTGPVVAQDSVPSRAYARVNAALAQNHIIPRYERLSRTTGALADAARPFCAGDGHVAPSSLGARFHDAMDAWMGVQHLRFGPAELFMRAQRLYFWPEARGRFGEAVRDLLAASEPDGITARRLPDASVAVQGLPAVELLLYSGKELSAGNGKDAKPCTLLVALTANIHDMAAGIVGDWRGGNIDFAHTFTTSGRDNPYYATHRDATLALFKSLYGGLQLIADVKLKPVVGEKIATARPRLAEASLSGRAMRNIVVNLEALQALYVGEAGPGLATLVRDHGNDPKLDPLMQRAFGMTLETARSIDRPLGDAVTDPALRPVVEKLLTQVLALKQIVRTRLAAALDVAVGFNALDGD